MAVLTNPTGSRLFGVHMASASDDRLAIPRKLVPSFRECCGADDVDLPEIVITVSLGQYSGLWVMPAHTFELALKEADRADNSGGRRRMLLGTLDRQALDRRNRLRIPRIMTKTLGLGMRLVVVGEGDRLGIMNMEEWERAFVKGQSRPVDEVLSRLAHLTA